MKLSGIDWVLVMLVASVIVFIGAIALPRYLRNREKSIRNRCIGSLRQYSGAIDQWAIDNGNADTDTVIMNDVTMYLKALPICRAGGTYIFTTVAANPTCSVHGDILP
jgi:hypothetical protein